MHVLCAGDDFITPTTFVDALRPVLDPDTAFTTHASRWPTEPWYATSEIAEAAGDEDEIAEAVRDADVLVTHLAPVTTRVLSGADRLRLVATPRGGPTNVDLEAATKQGVAVVNLPGRNARAVAEFTVGVLIAGRRNIARSHARMRDGDWTGDLYRYDEAGPELAGSTVGLVGLGQVGSRVADLLRAFGVHLLASDPYVDPDVAAERGVELVGLAELVERSDVVSLHARLSDETRGLIDADVLGQVKPGAYLVNTARGELLDEDALVDALRSGRLSGAALDVYVTEPPPPDHPLLGLPQVLTVSHLAGASTDVAHRAARRMADEVRRFVDGEPLAHCLNPEVLR
ncbi:2-hydroxyacid dehydrogenase [Actinomycetospora straminea]|uniref:2-hydroxyacid dehydrogenase n=1 Tax=Actinomycetospora straminea TaxID=663607 RepID=A0ABP9EF77_9PSEU|nr:2-hydroxyacid dehydrogenase [Actinomycetospora straminea]MDD7934428.1 2-hydroxyacid dehydrogenase [Actinomycetospora straminea]